MTDGDAHFLLGLVALIGVAGIIVIYFDKLGR